MHGHYGQWCLFGVGGQQIVLQKTEVWYVYSVIRIHGIGVEAYKMNEVGVETKVGFSKYLFESVHPRSQTVVVANEGDVRTL